MIEEKLCSCCKQILKAIKFSRSKTQKSGLCSHCKKCRAKKEKERRQNPEYRSKIKKYKSDPKNKRITKDRALKRLFGISITDYDQMYEFQNGLCAICKQLEPAFHIRNLAVDHCHKTGKVRGLLCTPCNQGLGHFQDNIEIMNSAINYLKEKN